MSTIANAKVEHNYNCYNGYFFGCLLYTAKDLMSIHLKFSEKIAYRILYRKETNKQYCY